MKNCINIKSNQNAKLYKLQGEKMKKFYITCLIFISTLIAAEVDSTTDQCEATNDITTEKVFTKDFSGTFNGQKLN